MAVRMAHLAPSTRSTPVALVADARAAGALYATAWSWRFS